MKLTIIDISSFITVLKCQSIWNYFEFKLTMYCYKYCLSINWNRLIAKTRSTYSNSKYLQDKQALFDPCFLWQLNVFLSFAANRSVKERISLGWEAAKLSLLTSNVCSANDATWRVLTTERQDNCFFFNYQHLVKMTSC